MHNSKSKILNLWLVNQLDKEELGLRNSQKKGQKLGFWDRKSYKNAPDCIQEQVKPFNDIPVIKPQPVKWANTSINHNLRAFLLINDIPDSGNPFNDHSIFEDYPIISEGWKTPFWHEYPKRNVSHHRQVRHENASHFYNIFYVAGFDKNNPICLDRNGHILDGYTRMRVMYNLHERGEGGRVYIRQYDF